MLVAGDYSPHLNDTVAMNARLDPSNSTWMKVKSQSYFCSVVLFQLNLYQPLPPVSDFYFFHAGGIVFRLSVCIYVLIPDRLAFDF